MDCNFAVHNFLCLIIFKLAIISCGGSFMTEITSKELTMISDALTFESLICKKARIYSKTLIDADLAEVMGKIADEHEQRFKSLLGVIGG
jgi:hypothetical protein